MYLAATWPFMTPAMTMVGIAIPYAIFCSRGDVEPRAGLETPMPA